MNFYPFHGPSFMWLIGLLILVLEIVVVIDIFKSSMDMTNKLLWAILVVVFPVLGIILYFFFGRNGRLRV